jgi:hypothetical protein
MVLASDRPSPMRRNGRLLCGAKTRAGGCCQVRAEPGKARCRFHAHAHQFKRANRSLRKLKTYLGRVIRDIGRRIDGDPELEEIFAQPLSFSRCVLAQDQRQRGPKVYSLRTRRKWSASARARRIGHTSSG